MKKTKTLLLLFLASLAGISQPYAERTYVHGTANSFCSSGNITNINTNGFIMASYIPSGTAAQPSFYIDKMSPGGVFGPASTFPFSRSYKVFGNRSCVVTVPATNMTSVKIIETNINGTEWYALAGTYSEGCFFATLDAGGNVVNRILYPFPTNATFPSQPSIVESTTTPNEYLICGSYVQGTVSRMYMLRVDAAGNPLQSRLYTLPGGSLYPQAMIISPYTPLGFNEVVVVGYATGNSIFAGTKALFMRIDEYNLNNVILSDIYGQPATFNGNDSFYSINIATSTTGTNGFVIGGYTDASLASSGDVWMLKVSDTGGIVWNTVMMPNLAPQAKVVNGVIERFSTQYGYTYYGSVTSNLGTVVVKLDDNGIPFTAASPLVNFNNFLYPGPGSQFSTPAAISYIDNGGAFDTGIHIYGTDNRISGGNPYFVEAAFNGYSAPGCNASVQSLSTIYTNGPNNIQQLNLNVGNGPNPCGVANFNITSNLITTNINTNCISTTLPAGGSNNKTVGLQSNTADAGSFAVYPNPASGKIQITYNAGDNSQVKIALHDYLGRHIKDIAPANTSNGSAQAVETDLGALGIESGIYVISVTIDGKSSSQKIVYTKN